MAEQGDAHVQDPLKVADPIGESIPGFPNDTVSRPYFLDVVPSTSSEPSQSHRPSIRNPLDENGSRSVSLQMNFPGDNTTSAIPPVMSTRTSVPSEPSSRVIHVHTDVGMTINAHHGKEIVEEVEELLPWYRCIPLHRKKKAELR